MTYDFAEDAPASTNMDDSGFDWGDWDRQANEYLTSSDYTGPSFSTGDGQQWGGIQPTQDYSFDNNLGNLPGNEWANQGQINLTPQEQFASGQMPTTTNWNPNTSGDIQNTLANLFNSKGFVTGLGVLGEGYQNKKKATALQQMVNQNRQQLDPFGSQRPFYQQQLQQAVQDPYSAPIVRNQVDALAQEQRIADAKAGRRSNNATSSPALLAAQAQVAQKYMNSLQTPAGANIGPQGLSSLLSAQQQGINYDVNGYLSPALSAMGRSAGMDQNTKTLEALRELLTGGK